MGGGRRVHDPERGWHSPYWEPIASGCRFKPMALEFQGGAPWSRAAEGLPTFFLDGLNALSRLRHISGGSAALPGSETAVLGRVGRELVRRTGVELDLTAILREDLARRQTALPLFQGILNRADPKVVVVECSYDKHTLIEAAQREAVPVVEIQHGVVSRHHFGYHFPRQSGTPAVFPDWFLAWGNYWKTAAVYPMEAHRILATGFPRFDRERGSVEHLQPSDTILFLSQTMLGDVLSRFAAELADLGFRDRIVYRLHPLEVTGWRNLYPWLVDAGVRVSGPEVPLYGELRTAAIHVGTFSTALFEGLGLGAAVYLVEAPGVEYMTELIEGDWVTLTRTPAELATAIRTDEHRPASRIRENFFRAGALDHTCTAIEAIARGNAPGKEG